MGLFFSLHGVEGTPVGAAADLAVLGDQPTPRTHRFAALPAGDDVPATLQARQRLVRCLLLGLLSLYPLGHRVGSAEGAPWPLSKLRYSYLIRSNLT